MPRRQKKLGPGIHRGLPFSKYLEIEAVSSTTLRKLRTSPENTRPDPWEEKESRWSVADRGTAAHCAILEPAQWNNRYEVFTGSKLPRGQRGNSAKDGMVAITERERDIAFSIRDAVLKNPWAAGLLQAAEPEDAEVSVIWEERGITNKSRGDLWVGHILADLKTTVHVTPRRWWNNVYDQGLHIQAAHYIEGALSTDPDPVPVWWWWIVAENRYPYRVFIYPLNRTISGEGKQTLEAGRMARTRLMTKYQDCDRSGLWESPPNPPVTGEMPEWAFRANEEPYSWER